jgi:hypothetical protein
MTAMRRTGLAFVAAALIALPAAAEPGRIAVEFNDLQQADEGCRAVFVLNNGLDQALGKLALRVVAFDREQHAKLFLSLDVGALPVGKTRIVRFDLGEGVACESVGRLVLDDVTACEAEGTGVDPAACLAAAALSTRAGVPFDF